MAGRFYVGSVVIDRKQMDLYSEKGEMPGGTTGGFLYLHMKDGIDRLLTSIGIPRFAARWTHSNAVRGGLGGIVRAVDLYAVDGSKAIVRNSLPVDIPQDQLLAMSNAHARLDALLTDEKMTGYAQMSLRFDKPNSRTVFVPRRFSHAGEYYAGFEIKGFAPDLDNPYRVNDQMPNGPEGGLMAQDAIFAYDNCLDQVQRGKVDPIPLLTAELPVPVSYDGVISGNIGLYVRGRKTNVDLVALWSILEQFLSQSGLTAAQYKDMFRLNMLQDMKRLFESGKVHYDFHSQNVSILGHIKDENDFMPYQVDDSWLVHFNDSDERLIRNLGEAFEHLRLLRRELFYLGRNLDELSVDERMSLVDQLGKIDSEARQLEDFPAISEVFGAKIKTMEQWFWAARRMMRKSRFAGESG